MIPVKQIGTAAVIAAGLGFATVASAAPLPAGHSGLAGSAGIEQVRDGCGYGAARNYYGECKYGRNYDVQKYGGGSAYRPDGGGYGYGYGRPRPSYRAYGPRRQFY